MYLVTSYEDIQSIQIVPYLSTTETPSIADVLSASER